MNCCTRAKLILMRMCSAQNDPELINMSRLSTNVHAVLNDAVISNLFNKHIFTTLQFIQTEIKQLTLITGLTYKNVLLLRRQIINKKSAVTRNGLEYYAQLTVNSAIIPTGIRIIDEVLDGGLATGNIYEICGVPACGKTQLSLMMAKNVAKSLQCVYYLDTKGDVNIRRIKSMLDIDKLSEVDVGEIMTKILVKHLKTEYDLINSLYAIKEEIKNGQKIRLIILDSLPPLFYQSSNITQTRGVLNLIVNVMRFLATEYYISFVVTNILTTWYDGSFEEKGILREKISCGKYWLSVPNVRLKISKEKDASEELYTVTLLKTNKQYFRK